MGGHRLTGPNRAYFLGRVIADCENKIEFRCTWRGELIPILASQAVRGQVGKFELMQRLGANTSRGMTSGAICSEVWSSLTVHDGFGHYGSSGIARA